VLGHPVFDEIAQAVYENINWVPWCFMILYKPPGASGAGPHRDTSWVEPTPFNHVRFLCQIQLTPPSDTDGGVYYLPKSHLLQDNKTMINQYDIPDDSPLFVPFKGVSLQEMNFHNVGVIHRVPTNRSSVMAKRLYIGILDDTEIYSKSYILTRSGMREKVLEAKKLYKDMFGE
jgi:hypothetical protein